MNIELLIMVLIAVVAFWAVYTDAKEIRALKKRVKDLEKEVLPYAEEKEVLPS